MSTKQDDPSKNKRVECEDDERVNKCNLVVRNVTHPLRYYEFTRDEIKALEECDKESFYRRCLPFSAIFATATYAAVNYGLLKRNPHLGALPKVLIACVFGYYYGRYSYIPHCENKLVRLPANSHLGNTMRKHYCERQCKAK